MEKIRFLAVLPMLLICHVQAFGQYETLETPHEKIDGLYYDIWTPETKPPFPYTTCAWVTCKDTHTVYEGTHLERTIYESAGYSGDVVIPYAVKYRGTTYGVFGVLENAFYGCNIDNLFLPEDRLFFDFAGKQENFTVHNIHIHSWEWYHMLEQQDKREPIPAILSHAEHVFLGGQEYDMENFRVPACMENIYSGKFRGCWQIKTIDFGNHVRYIGDNAFLGCIGLTNVTIPDQVKTIADGAFSYCENLSELTIGAGVREIYSEAFKECLSLKSVVSLIETPFDISEDVFSPQTYQKATLYVPKGTREKYASLQGWRNFQNIQDAEMLGITPMNADQAVRVSGIAGGVVVENAVAGMSCQICHIDGKLVYERPLSEGTTTILLPTGQMYVVRVGRRTFKVMVE